MDINVNFTAFHVSLAFVMSFEVRCYLLLSI